MGKQSHGEEPFALEPGLLRFALPSPAQKRAPSSAVPTVGSVGSWVTLRGRTLGAENPPPRPPTLLLPASGH